MAPTASLRDYRKFRASLNGETVCESAIRRRRTSRASIKVTAPRDLHHVERGRRTDLLLKGRTEQEVYFNIRMRLTVDRNPPGGEDNVRVDRACTGTLDISDGALATVLPQGASSHVKLHTPCPSSPSKLKQEITVDFSARKGSPRKVTVEILDASGLCDNDSDQPTSASLLPARRFEQARVPASAVRCLPRRTQSEAIQRTPMRRDSVLPARQKSNDLAAMALHVLNGKQDAPDNMSQPKPCCPRNRKNSLLGRSKSDDVMLMALHKSEACDLDWQEQEDTEDLKFQKRVPLGSVRCLPQRAQSEAIERTPMRTKNRDSFLPARQKSNDLAAMALHVFNGKQDVPDNMGQPKPCRPRSRNNSLLGRSKSDDLMLMALHASVACDLDWQEQEDTEDLKLHLSVDTLDLLEEEVLADLERDERKKERKLRRQLEGESLQKLLNELKGVGVCSLRKCQNNDSIQCSILSQLSADTHQSQASDNGLDFDSSSDHSPTLSLKTSSYEGIQRKVIHAHKPVFANSGSPRKTSDGISRPKTPERKHQQHFLQHSCLHLDLTVLDERPEPPKNQNKPPAAAEPSSVVEFMKIDEEEKETKDSLKSTTLHRSLKIRNGKMLLRALSILFSKKNHVDSEVGKSPTTQSQRPPKRSLMSARVSPTANISPIATDTEPSERIQSPVTSPFPAIDETVNTLSSEECNPKGTELLEEHERPLAIHRDLSREMSVRTWWQQVSEVTADPSLRMVTLEI